MPPITRPRTNRGTTSALRRFSSRATLRCSSSRALATSISSEISRTSSGRPVRTTRHTPASMVGSGGHRSCRRWASSTFSGSTCATARRCILPSRTTSMAHQSANVGTASRATRCVVTSRSRLLASSIDASARKASRWVWVAATADASIRWNACAHVSAMISRKSSSAGSGSYGAGERQGDRPDRPPGHPQRHGDDRALTAVDVGEPGVARRRGRRPRPRRAVRRCGSTSLAGVRWASGKTSQRPASSATRPRSAMSRTWSSSRRASAAIVAPTASAMW